MIAGAAAICAGANPASVSACDPSPAFIDAAHRSLPDARVTFTNAGAGSLPRRKGGYDAAVSGLALNFLPDPPLAIVEQLDAVRPGGVVGAYVWDYALGMEFLRHFWDAATTIEPRAAEADEGRRFPLCKPQGLEALFRSAGAERLRGGALSVPTVFSDFQDYWRPFLGGTGPAPSLVAALSDQQRAALVDELKRRLGVQSGGAIVLQARAWAVAGYRS